MPDARQSMRDRERRRMENARGGSRIVQVPDGVDLFKVDGKPNNLDIIQYRIGTNMHPDVRDGAAQIGDLAVAYVYKYHADVGAEGKLYLCPTTIGKPCPICEAYKQGKDENKPEEEIKGLKAKTRVLYNVIDLDSRDQKVQVWDISLHNFPKQLQEECKLNEDYWDFGFLDGGYTIKVRWREKTIGRGKPFYESQRIDFEKREPYDEAILNEAISLDKLFPSFPDYKMLEKVLLGIGDEDDDDELTGEPAPEPTRRRAAPAPPAHPAEVKPAGEPAPARRRPPETGTEAPETPPAAPTGARRRGTPPANPAPTPAAPAEQPAGRHPVDPDQDMICPGGGEFGVDTDELEACATCEIWKPCFKAKKENSGAAKPAAAPTTGAGSSGARRRR